MVESEVLCFDVYGSIHNQPHVRDCTAVGRRERRYRETAATRHKRQGDCRFAPEAARDDPAGDPPALSPSATSDAPVMAAVAGSCAASADATDFPAIINPTPLITTNIPYNSQNC